MELKATKAAYTAKGLPVSIGQHCFLVATISGFHAMRVFFCVLFCLLLTTVATCDPVFHKESKKYHSPYYPSSPKGIYQPTKAVHGSICQAFFVHILGGWLRKNPPVAWVIFSKLLELFWNLELFLQISSLEGYFWFKIRKFCVWKVRFSEKYINFGLFSAAWVTKT